MPEGSAMGGAVRIANNFVVPNDFVPFAGGTCVWRRRYAKYDEYYIEIFQAFGIHFGTLHFAQSLLYLAPGHTRTLSRSIV